MMAKLLKNVKIRLLIILGVDVLLCLQLAMGVSSIAFTRSIAGDTRTLYNRPHTNLVSMWRVKTNTLLVGSELRKSFISGKGIPQEAREMLDGMYDAIDVIERNKVDPSAPRSENMQKIMDACELWAQRGGEIADLLAQGRVGEVTGKMQVAYNDSESDLVSKMDAIIETATVNAVSFMEKAQASSSRSTAILAVLFAGAIILSLLVLRIILRGIAQPMEALVAAAGQIAGGRLDCEIPYESKNEFGVLADEFRSMKQNLKTIIGDISRLLGRMGDGDFSGEPSAAYIGDFSEIGAAMERIAGRLSEALGGIDVAADQVSVGSDQVSSGAQALAQGATEQASTIEELLSRFGVVSGHVDDSARRAGEASERTGAAAREMQSGRGQMEKLTDAIRRVSASSGEIGSVIKTIEDIAFQTNILALNAAVEAARAGAAGKGFAVVADEVRNLAGKSSEAAKSTTAMIEQSIAAIQEGDRITQETAESFMRVADAAQAAAELVDGIAAAAQEQRRAMNEITVGIDQISSVVQTNSATAEQSAAASEELSGQAQRLKELTGRFSLRASARAEI